MVNPRALIFVFGAIAFWSTNAVVAKWALRGLAVEQVQLLQFASAAVVFAALFWSERMGRADRSIFSLKALALGLVGLTGTMVFQYLAFANAPIAQANIVAYGWPLLAAMWVALSYRHRDKALSLIVPALAGFVGVWLVIGEGRDFVYRDAHAFGYVFALLSALCMAVYTVGISRTTLTGARLLLPASLAGVGIAAIWCLYEGGAWPGWMYIAMGVYLGAGPIGAGYLLWSLAARSDDPGRIAVFGYLTPVCSTSLLVLSGERLTGPPLAGAVLVIASCIYLGARNRWSADETG